MTTPLPVHLITGLLGSGKTTCLKNLIQQKPANEHWVILINEFAEVDIDASQLIANPNLSEDSSNSIEIQAVSGGCICCTAQLGLVNTLNKIFSQTTKKIDRIWIEPTGLGHPAKIIDALQQTQFLKPVQLQKIACVVTPLQLTVARWQKSAVMRDLVNLADTIILNKTDLADDKEILTAKTLLQNCYPPKNEVIETQYTNLALNTLLTPRIQKSFTLLSQFLPNNTLKASTAQDSSFHDFTDHKQQTLYPQQAFNSSIPGTQQCFVSQTDTSELLSMGWIWNNDLQFNRVKLKTFFTEIAPYIIRAKGLLKTGKEWQLVNWSTNELQFEEIAWRQDNRLECLFKMEDDLPTNQAHISIQTLESKLKDTIHNLIN